MAIVIVQFAEGDAPWITDRVAHLLTEKLRKVLADYEEPISEDEISDAVCDVMRENRTPEFERHLRAKMMV